MGKIIKTAAAILAVLFIAAGTVSAQGKKVLSNSFFMLHTPATRAQHS